jgi:hypothetical protein
MEITSSRLERLKEGRKLKQNKTKNPTYPIINSPENVGIDLSW